MDEMAQVAGGGCGREVVREVCEAAHQSSIFSGDARRGGEGGGSGDVTHLAWHGMAWHGMAWHSTAQHIIA